MPANFSTGRLQIPCKVTECKQPNSAQDAERQLLGLLGEQTAAALEARSAVAGIKALRTRLAERRAAAARTQDDLSRTQLATSKAEVRGQAGLYVAACGSNAACTVANHEV